MAITTLKLEKETKELLDKIKDKYEIKTYNLLLFHLSHYIIKNNINPKADITGVYQNSVVQLERRLTEDLAEMQKKLTNDNTTLRKWVGAITKDHLVPMQRQIYELTQSLDLDAYKKAVEAKAIKNVPKLYLMGTPQPEEPNELAEKLEKCNEESKELYRRYEEQKNALFKIFENSKIEQIGMTGTKTRVVVELSEQEWKDLKEVI